jgi:hypothetical protein
MARISPFFPLSHGGGALNHKTILRSLGHIKTFLFWAVAAGYVVDDRFETVTARDMTKEERLAGDRRRSVRQKYIGRFNQWSQKHPLRELQEFRDHYKSKPMALTEKQKKTIKYRKNLPPGTSFLLGINYDRSAVRMH